MLLPTTNLPDAPLPDAPLPDARMLRKKKGLPQWNNPSFILHGNPGLVLATVFLQSVLCVQDFIPALNGWLGEVFSPPQLIDYTG